MVYGYREYAVKANNKLTNETAQTICDMIIKYTKTKITDIDERSINELIHDILDNMREDLEVVEHLIDNPHKKTDNVSLNEIYIMYFQNNLLNTNEVQDKYNNYIFSRDNGNIMPEQYQYYKLVIGANYFINNITSKYKISIDKMVIDLSPLIFEEFKKYINRYIFPEIDKNDLRNLSFIAKQELFLETAICSMDNIKDTGAKNNNKLDEVIIKLDDVIKIKKKDSKTCELWEATTLRELGYIDFTKLP